MIRELKVQQRGKETFCIDVHPNSAITITNNCGECDFVERASCGMKPVCGHNRILAKRPYSTGDNSRAIQYDTIPSWCPLYTKEYNPNENQ